ncbi:MAG: prenyltransferase [Proteobacteria bacterium]|nr:prenyltransferase [Pseudomonadota bacterium]MBU4581882.1 prenyltransferase [Pseudomonadota bacterium]MCG2739222.1 prenyltransferase [Syntrophaceae bacterium]
MKFKGIVTVIRVPFLILALILGILGAAVAWYESRRFGTPFDMGYALLATFGLLVAHAAVNIFNEYFDCRSGLDYKTRRTPFSGGSGAIPRGLLTLQEAMRLGIACFVVIIPIGVFFTLEKGWMLVPLLVLATLLIVLYTPFILKMGYPEWSPGLGLGTLPVMGAYFVQTGEYTLTALIASMPSYFLVHNLLLLNEFPDVEADITVKRRTLPIVFGKKRAAVVFSLFVLLVYLWIVGAVMLHYMPVFALLALLTLPIALQVIKGSFRYDEMELFLPVMMKNVQLVLLIQALIAAGYILGGIFSG